MTIALPPWVLAYGCPFCGQRFEYYAVFRDRARRMHDLETHVWQVHRQAGWRPYRLLDLGG